MKSWKFMLFFGRKILHGNVVFLLPSGPKRTVICNLKSKGILKYIRPNRFLIALPYHWAGPFWNISAPSDLRL